MHSPLSLTPGDRLDQRAHAGGEIVVLELSLQGNTVAEISAQVGYSRRTVQRILLRVRSTLERLRE